MSHDPTLDRHRFDIDRPKPDSSISDDDLVDSFYRSYAGELFRTFGRRWELPVFIRHYLGGYGWIVDLGSLPFENTVQRMTHIIRSRNSIKGARTRKAKKLRAQQKAAREKEAAEKAQRKAAREARRAADKRAKEERSKRKEELVKQQLRLL